MASDGRISVFISYSHDSPEHAGRVLELAQRLARDGFHCDLDQYEVSPPEGWPHWTDRKLRDADFVLLVCTETYYRRVIGREEPGQGHGVNWEGTLIYQYCYNAKVNTRFVPVLLEGGLPSHIPEPLQGATQYFLDSTSWTAATPYQEAQYAALVQRLRGKAPARRPHVLTRAAPNVRLLPTQRNAFFSGREHALAVLHERFSGPQASEVQALSGLGGVGKSQIALEYAQRCRDRYDAVFWISASTQQTLGLGYSSIAEALGLSGGRDSQQTVQVVLRWMQVSGPWLLILDNVEAPEILAEFLPSSSQGHVLLTSRLRVLDAAGVVDPIVVTQMEEEEAAVFLLKRTGRDASATQEVVAARQLVSELGFLPLAIEQAGAYILANEVRFDEYLALYRQQPLQQLEQRRPVQGGYRNSVATTWRVNFQEIAKQEASLELLYLSALLHPDRIPIALITDGAAEYGPALSAALADAPRGAVSQLLEPLSRYSLIRRNVAEGTYSMHRLVQEVLRSEMTAEEHDLRRARWIRGMARALPEPEALYVEWKDCDDLLPQVEACAEYLHLAREAGVDLLIHAGFYATQRLQYGVAEAFLQKAISNAEQLAEAGQVRLANAFDRMGWLHFKRDNLTLAQQLYERALALREQVLSAEHLDFCNSWLHLAGLYDQQGRWADAEALYRKALALRQRELPDNHLSIGICLANLALLFEHQGRFSEALELGERAQRSFERHMGDSHSVLTLSLDNMGWLRYRMKEFDQAEALFRRALRIREREFGAEDPEVARSLTHLAILAWDTGKPDAESLFRRALEIRAAALPELHRDLLASQRNLGELYVKLGRFAEAEPLYDAALAGYRRAFGAEHPAVVEMSERRAALPSRPAAQATASD